MGKNPPASAGDRRDVGLIPGLGRSPGEGHGNPPGFLPGESHGQRSRVGYSPWGCKDLDTAEATKQAPILFGNILNVPGDDDNHSKN